MNVFDWNQAEVNTEEVSANLRYFKGKLQQLAIIKKYNFGKVISIAKEWRDVPTIEEE